MNRYIDTKDTLNIERGKYTVINMDSDKPLAILRYGKPWLESIVTIPGNNAYRAAFYELQELRKHRPHVPQIILGEILVCSVCMNSEGNPVAWELAHPGGDPYDVDKAVKAYAELMEEGGDIIDPRVTQIFLAMQGLLNASEQHKVEQIATELRYIVSRHPIALWSTYGGAPRETVLAMRAWLLEKASEYEKQRDDSAIMRMNLLELTQLIMGRTAPEAARAILKHYNLPKGD